MDDHALFRHVLRKLLEEEPDIRVVGELSDGRGVSEMLRKSEADLLLLDLEMPQISGYDVLRQLEDENAKIDTIVLTGSEDWVELAVALDLRARGIVPKKAATKQLLQAIRQVYRGGTWLDRSIPNLELRARVHLRDQHRIPGRPVSRGSEPWEDLTPRETEVALLVAEGLRYKEISSRLQMAPSTLNNHLRNIFDKLQVRGRVELALYGLRRKS